MILVFIVVPPVECKTHSYSSRVLLDWQTIVAPHVVPFFVKRWDDPLERESAADFSNSSLLYYLRLPP